MADIVKKLLNNKTKQPIELASELSVDELEKVIVYTADMYYNKKPVINDTIYDILIDFLKLKAPKSKVLKNIGAKPKGKNKVKLDYWLGSMDKIKPPSNQLSLWTKKYIQPYNLSDKLDGISALLTYNFDGSRHLYTRGTAEEGLDITPLVKYLNIPDYASVLNYCSKNKIEGDKNLIALRGELIIKSKTFEKNWSKKLKNARNSVSGLVNSKTINPELAKDTDFVVYEVVDPFYKIDKQFEIIEKLGFKIVTNKTIKQDLSYEYLSNYLKERRTKSDYDVDGVIITWTNNNKRNIDGNPEYAFAFKDVLEDQKAKTTIINIEWNISKDGYIKPTLLLKPVDVGGVTISRATANNAKFVVENVLGPGAEIEIIRSGDVIPKVQTVIKKAKSNKPQLPENPETWHWNETNVDIKINDIDTSSEVLIKTIYYFFSKLDTLGLGEKNVEKLIESGLNTIPKILAAQETDFMKVDGFKEKTSHNLVASIKKAMTNITLSKLMAASNRLGHGLGEERMKQILVTFPNLLTDYQNWTKTEFINNIKQINGWEEKTSTLFVNNFMDFINFYESIKQYVTLETKTKTVKGTFTEKTVVFSGFRDKELQETIEAQGGKIGSSISKNTDFLIVKDQSVLDNLTEKVKKAQELGISILTKDMLVKKLK